MALAVDVAVKADIIPMGEKKRVPSHLVPGFGQVDGHVACAITCGKTFRTIHVVIVLNTAVFAVLELLVRVAHMHLILLAEIGREECAVEVSRRLALIVASSVEVVGLESHAQTLTRIYREKGFEAVFTIGLVSAFMIGDIGEGGFCVGVEHLIFIAEEVVVG